jgi:hypothetical protein
MLASLLLLAAIAACAPSSALALTRAERKAVTVKAIDGASTATAAFVEITFKRQFEEMFGTKGLRKGSVKVQFVPASGKRTTIIETGPADEAERTRRGTKGFSESVRAGRTFSVFVRGLKAAAGKVIVTTTRRGKKKIDKQKGPLSTPVTEAELDLELDEADLIFGEAIDKKTDAEYARYARRRTSGRRKRVPRSASCARSSRSRRRRRLTFVRLQSRRVRRST